MVFKYLRIKFNIIVLKFKVLFNLFNFKIVLIIGNKSVIWNYELDLVEFLTE